MVNDNKQAKRVEVLRIQLYDKLSFSPHISNIYKSADNQSSALISQKFLSLEEKTVSLNNYFMARFFSNAVSLKKIENLQKEALRFFYKSYDTSNKDLLWKPGFLSMNIKRLITL